MDRQRFHDTMLAFLRDANPGTAIELLNDDDDLVDLGYLDSVRILELLVVLEDMFEISIALDAIDPRAFRSVYDVYEVVRLHQSDG